MGAVQTAYTVNPITDARPRASPYRGALFEATCSFPYNSSYPFCVPTVRAEPVTTLYLPMATASQ